jgi:probable rRNA maturation factor
MEKFTLKKNSKIHIHFVGDKEIQELNKMHRGKDYPTDVLSFNIDDQLPNGEYYIGDIIINIDQAKRQMGEYSNNDVRIELAELAEHGVLHLLGIHHPHDDE